jgi:hypothetical protein
MQGHAELQIITTVTMTSDEASTLYGFMGMAVAEVVGTNGASVPPTIENFIRALEQAEGQGSDLMANYQSADRSSRNSKSRTR